MHHADKITFLLSKGLQKSIVNGQVAGGFPLQQEIAGEEFLSRLLALGHQCCLRQINSSVVLVPPKNKAVLPSR